MTTRRSAVATTLAALVASAGLVGCGSSSTSRSERPTIVVTHAILSAVVSDIVGDRADVRTVIPNGKDPHEYSPTPRDIEALAGADLIVRNGGLFDQSLDRVIKDAQRGGVAVFIALDNVSSPPPGVRDDPHFFTDPVSMSQIIDPLAKQIRNATGVDVDDRAALERDQLNDVAKKMSAERAKVLGSGTNPGDCVLISGHESLAYIAARFECTVIGTVVPGLSSSGAASAADLAVLKQQAETYGVKAIFVESTMSTRVAVQLADELKLSVVPLDVEMLGEDGSYSTYVLTLLSRIVEGLGAA